MHRFVLLLLASIILASTVSGSHACGKQVEAPAKETKATETEPPKAEAKGKEEKAKKQRPTWSVKPDAKLPNVLILGDSISIGYTLIVRSQLAGKANVFRPVSADGTKPENCSGTTKGVKQIDAWLAVQKWDVIHFNWGLHDLKKVKEAGTPQNSDDPNDPYQADLEQYSKNLREIVEKLKATDAQLVFATTTPIVADSDGPHRAVEDPARYNAAAVAIMEENKIDVNDLFAACEGKLEELQRPKNVHFRHSGSKLLGQHVAQAIEAKLPVKESPKE